MSSAARVFKPPNEVFLTAPPPPRPRVYSDVHLPPRASSLPWKTCNPDTRLEWALSFLQRTLGSLHKRKVSWPEDESFLTTLSTREYLKHLLQPIANMYNELQLPGTFLHPIECVQVDLGDYINSATFDMHQNKLRDKIPLVLSLPGTLFDAQGNPSPQTLSAVARAIAYNPEILVVIVTNFEDIAVFQCPIPEQPDHIYTRVSTTQPALSLRVLTMAYMNSMLPWGYRINATQPDFGDEELVVQGPPVDPNQPLIPDEQVFATHHRYSDFDEPTLLNDRARASQFFRWLNYIRQHCSKVLLRPGDEVTAMTDAIPSVYARVKLPQPLFPFAHSDLPPQTTAHLHAIQRPSPLAQHGLEDALRNSSSFSLKIDNVISEGSVRSISTVYRCRILSVDGRPISDSPSLCLKLFDDRFQPRECPDDDDEGDGERAANQVDGEPDGPFAILDDGARLEFAAEPEDYDEYRDYLTSVVHADRLVMTEKAAYEKLLRVQGSLVPWFYGVHKFILPDGMYIHGILMEYLEGIKLNSKPETEISTERQLALIQSCRHGAHVFDAADIHQYDWHGGQVFLHTNPTSKIDHAIFFDFAATAQSYSIGRIAYMDNYIQLLRVLLGRSGYAWLDEMLVWDNYGEPDDWDPVMAFMNKGGEQVTVEAKDQFAFISVVY